MGLSKNIAIHMTGELLYKNGINVSHMLMREEHLELIVGESLFSSAYLTPCFIQEFAMGYLYAEGIIASPEDVVHLRVCDSRVHICFTPELMQKISAAGGISAYHKLIAANLDDLRSISSMLAYSADELIALINKTLSDNTVLDSLAAGYFAAKVQKGEVAKIATDINPLHACDKLAGLIGVGLDFDGTFMSNGKCSVELIIRLCKMNVAIAVFNSLPSNAAVNLARTSGMTLIGKAGEDLIIFADSRKRVIF